MRLVFIRILSVAGMSFVAATGAAHSQDTHGSTTNPASAATHGPIVDPTTPASDGPISDPATSATSGAFAWDATWVGGWEGGEGTQVVIAGGQVIGFFWSGDYLSIENSTNLADGYPIKFIWPGGEAIVQPGPHAELLLLIHEEGKPQTGFILTRQ